MKRGRKKRVKKGNERERERGRIKRAKGN